MDPVTPDLIKRALAGEASAVSELFKVIIGVSRIRIARILFCRSGDRYRDLGQEVNDLAQDVVIELIKNDYHRLKSWDPERGASFENFVGLIARQKAAETFRKQGDGLWRDLSTTPEDLDMNDSDYPTPESIVNSRRALEEILTRLRAQLSEQGNLMFHLLFIEQCSVAETCSITGMSEEAVYAWRSRLGSRAAQIARELLEEPPEGAE